MNFMMPHPAMRFFNGLNMALLLLPGALFFQVLPVWAQQELTAGAQGNGC
jgi:hypothetical protein